MRDFIWHFLFRIKYGLIWTWTFFWGCRGQNKIITLSLLWWVSILRCLISLLVRVLPTWSMWLNCTFEKSIIFMNCHYTLFLIKILGFRVTFGAFCGIYPIPSLTLVMLIILKLTGKQRMIISSLGIRSDFRLSFLTTVLQIGAPNLAHSSLFMRIIFVHCWIWLMFLIWRGLVHKILLLKFKRFTKLLFKICKVVLLSIRRRRMQIRSSALWGMQTTISCRPCWLRIFFPWENITSLLLGR